MPISASKSALIYAPYYSSDKPFTHSISFTEDSVDNTNNTSTLSFEASIQSSYVSFSGGTAHYLSIYWFDDNSYTAGYRVNIKGDITSMNAGDTVTITGSLTVRHGSDGKLSGYAASYWSKMDSNGFVPSSNAVQTATTSLTDIPRVSSITLSKSSLLCNGTNAQTISITRGVSTYTDTLTYSIGSGSSAVTGTIATKTSNKSVTWTVPKSILSAIPNSKSGKVSIKCTTYNGNTSLGTTTKTFTVTTNDAANGPIMSNTIEDNNENQVFNGHTLSEISGGRLVSNMSELHVVSTCTGQNGATIPTITIAVGDQVKAATPVSGESNKYEATFTGNLGSGLVTIVATDSRGNTSTDENYTNVGEVIPYFAPTFANVSADRLTASDVVQDPTLNPTETIVGSVTGTWYSGVIGGDGVNPVYNTLSLSVEYTAPYGGPASLTPTTSSSDNAFSFSGILFTGLSDSSASNIKFVVSDVFGQLVESRTISIYEYFPVFAMFKNHFDVFGEFHIHDRNNVANSTVFRYNSNDYFAGEQVVFTSNYAMFVGFVSGDGGVIAFSIPLAKNIKSGLVVDVDGYVHIRHSDGGYIGAAPVKLSNLGTVTVDYDVNYVRVRVALSTPTTKSNNAVICVSPAPAEPGIDPLTITFSNPSS